MQCDKIVFFENKYAVSQSYKRNMNNGNNNLIFGIDLSNSSKW